LLLAQSRAEQPTLVHAADRGRSAR
jgi:hypothetical protein